MGPPRYGAPLTPISLVIWALILSHSGTRWTYFASHLDSTCPVPGPARPGTRLSRPVPGPSWAVPGPRRPSRTHGPGTSQEGPVSDSARPFPGPAGRGGPSQTSLALYVPSRAHKTVSFVVATSSSNGGVFPPFASPIPASPWRPGVTAYCRLTGLYHAESRWASYAPESSYKYSEFQFSCWTSSFV